MSASLGRRHLVASAFVKLPRTCLRTIELLEDDAFHDGYQRAVALRAEMTAGVESQLEIVLIDELTLKEVHRNAMRPPRHSAQGIALMRAASAATRSQRGGKGW